MRAPTSSATSHLSAGTYLVQGQSVSALSAHPGRKEGISDRLPIWAFPDSRVS